MMIIKIRSVVFCGLVLSVLAIGPKVRGFSPAEGNGFLRPIKICSMPSFGRGNKAAGTMS
jgi:hypothetical protein